jgi:hypothetical protein
MPRVPYDRLAPEANKVIEKMTLAKDLKTISYYWDIYVSLLAGSGWDPVSFDQETAKRIDEGWDETLTTSKPDPTIWN